MSPWIIPITVLILSCIYLVFHEWKVKPVIAKRRKKKIKEKEEKEQEEKRQKQQKVDAINQQWKTNREALQSMRGPLMEFNQMNRFPDSYRWQKCIALASQIDEQAVKIVGDQFQPIKTKLLEYAGRREQVYQHLGFKPLKDIFQRRINDEYEPLALWREVEEILKKTADPPFSENDL